MIYEVVNLNGRTDDLDGWVNNFKYCRKSPYVNDDEDLGILTYKGAIHMNI